MARQPTGHHLPPPRLAACATHPPAPCRRDRPPAPPPNPARPPSRLTLPPSALPPTPSTVSPPLLFASSCPLPLFPVDPHTRHAGRGGENWSHALPTCLRLTAGATSAHLFFCCCAPTLLWGRCWLWAPLSPLPLLLPACIFFCIAGSFVATLHFVLLPPLGCLYHWRPPAAGVFLRRSRR